MRSGVLVLVRMAEWCSRECAARGLPERRKARARERRWECGCVAEEGVGWG